VATTYLLARLADTITDCGNWKREDRLSYLDSFEAAILKADPTLFKGISNVGSHSESEAELLLQAPHLLRDLANFSQKHLIASQEVLRTRIHAMKWDLNAFPAAGSQADPAYAIADTNKFDWYCFSIAGCVGRYWVSIFDLPSDLEHFAIAYGKGL